jgi:tRNA-specific 2-thiouridylase
MAERIAVGLSGGIDSSFAAYLLRQQGWDVVGVTLKFFPEENRCCDLDSLYQAQRLCHSLEIPHYVVDVQNEFKHQIIRYFINSYLQGITPNPCAFCNRLIKFGLFFDKVRSFGIKYLATGHYANIECKNGKFLLKKAKDINKSQEYFLSLISPAVLPYTVFPLGSYSKQEVKKIVREKKIIFRERPESQDVCFVKDRSYVDFIERSIGSFDSYKGQVTHVNGMVLGQHKGIYYFTYGQRGGLGISWKEPLYVTDIDPLTRTVTVGEKRYLYKNEFVVEALNWFDCPEGYDNFTVKIRYNSPAYSCRIGFLQDTNKIKVVLTEKVNAITPGQVATFYYKDFVIGAGIISK